MLAVGVDVGGTKIAGGVVDARGEVLRRARRDTPSTDSKAVQDAIAELVAELRTAVSADLAPDEDVCAVGIGAAGFVDAARATVLFAPNLAWRDEPLRAEVAARVGLPVVVENDANAAAWGETRFGAAAGRENAVCVTVGTGIGGGVVVDGHLLRGRFGMAAEFGHMRVVPEGVQCGCGQFGCWEQYASGRALVRRARGLVTAGTPASGRLRELCGGEPADLTGPMVTAAAAAGDPASVGLFAELGDWLGAGLASLAAVLDPGCFVIGGGVAEVGELLLGPARESFRRRLPAGSHRPLAEILPAALGNDAGIVGAADLARADCAWPT
jgi:glucokinase